VAAIGVGAMVRWTPPSAVADLRPWPDALEYEEAGRRLAAGEGYVIVVEGNVFPPRYPPGFSLLLVPFLRADDQSGAGIRGVFAASLIAVLGTAAIGWAVGGWSGAIAATLVLALSPLHARWSRAVMSDVPASAAVAALAAAILMALRRGAGAGVWFGIGLGIGSASAIRQTVLLLALPAAALLAAAHPGERARRVLAIGAGGLVGLVPTLVLNAYLFGSPLRTGYDVWAPGLHFDATYLWAPPPHGEARGNLSYYLTMILGDGRAYPWPIALLLGLSAVEGLRRGGVARSLTILGLGYAGALVAAHGAFYWQADRFLVPALPLLASFAALAVGHAAPRAARGLALALLCAGVLSTGPWDVVFAAPDRDLRIVESMRTIDRVVEPNAAILAATNSYFFERELRRHGDRVWIPVGLDTHRRAIAVRGLRPLTGEAVRPDWVALPVGQPVRPDDVRATIDGMIEEGRPVYLMSKRAFPVPTWPRLLRVLRRHYRLEPVVGVSSVLLLRVLERPAAAPPPRRR
jgi:hypothetical protein